jgi:hypothetical protein
MSSSYPSPPPATASGAAPPQDPAQQQAVDADNTTLQAHTQQLYAADAAAAAAAAAAVAAAHHGLQAVQAAVAAPAPVSSASPVTPQHAPLGDASYLTGAPVGIAGSPHNPKATRLRRACDMCSQRKVKVRSASVIGRFVTPANS